MPLDQRCAEPPRGSVERNARTRDPSAYDEDVELLFSEPPQRFATVEGALAAGSVRTLVGPLGVHSVSLPQTQTPPSGRSPVDRAV